MKFEKTMDSISEVVGRIAGWMFFATVLMCAYEVIMRKVFSSPTFWSFDISYMVGGSAGLMGAAFTMKAKRHVRVDFFYAKMPRKAQLILDICFTVVLFFPLFILGNVITFKNALESISIMESIQAGLWKPPIWPLKTIIFLSMFLLLLQVVAEFIRTIRELHKISGKVGA